MKKILIAIIIFIVAIIMLAGGLLIAGDAYAKNYKFDAPEQIEIEANEFGTITAVGRGLYDSDGFERFLAQAYDRGTILNNIKRWTMVKNSWTCQPHGTTISR